jgi:hypothetical protein
MIKTVLTIRVSENSAKNLHTSEETKVIKTKKTITNLPMWNFFLDF